MVHKVIKLTPKLSRLKKNFTQKKTKKENKNSEFLIFTNDIEESKHIYKKISLQHKKGKRQGN